MKLQFKSVLFVSTFSLLSFFSYAQAEIKVIASIKPIHSLVSYVMDGVGTPEILVDGSSSPHSFQLKPSHAKMLQNADIVFWIGEDLETFLETPLDSIATNARKIAIMELNDIQLLEFREKHIFEDHDEHVEEMVMMNMWKKMVMMNMWKKMVMMNMWKKMVMMNIIMVNLTFTFG